MQILGGLLGGSFVLASLVVGSRLVLLARRTRRVAELHIGAGLLLLAVFGYPLMVVARRAQALPDSTRSTVAFVGALCLAVGGWWIVCFVRGVFRRESRAASFVVWAYAAVAGGLLAWQSVAPGWWTWVQDQQGPWAAARWITLVPICWGGVESLRYWVRMRRRLALGLTDALVTDRFRLFGISMLAGFVANAGTVVYQVRGVDVIGTAVGAVVVSPASIAAVALWLAFLPPAAYRRWIHDRSNRLVISK
ncbi:MAG: hypothetical protein ACQGVC_07480 [Myxococcota bacterium]